MENNIVWFRKDLRVHDNPALWEASQHGHVIPVFIWSNEEEKDYRNSAASKWWLHHSLLALKAKLAEEGLKLIVRAGNSLEELNSIVDDTDAKAIFYNERYETTIKNRDQSIQNSFLAKGIGVFSYHSQLLFQPYDIKNKKNEPYKVFTSFYKQVINTIVARPVPSPSEQAFIEIETKSLNLKDLNLLPQIRWDKKLNNYWSPGEEEAIERFESFATDGLVDYKQGRNIPSEKNVSSLSPFLTWGNISVRAIWYSLENKYDEQLISETSLDAFKRQLIWREFSYHQLIHFPEITYKPLREQFEMFPWINNGDDFDKWKQGMTGYPLVDAGMRELIETGVIHNRVRMVVGSFLVKHLLISWTKGYDWFSETLVDFDVANNALGWQWIAGSGVETAPYFRIFNPIIQSEKFDKDGIYIRKWIPELRELDTKYIHQPWKAPKEVLKEANIELDSTYPSPIVDHSAARKRALAAFEEIKQSKQVK